MNEISLAWAAGFFDGEGSIQLKGKYSSIYIGQKERELLDFFLSIVGWGKVSDRRDYKSVKGKDTYIYTYYAGGDTGTLILIKLLPFLRGKKSQAILAIENHIKLIGQYNHAKLRYRELSNLYNTYKNTPQT